jgi:SAM-dependent methyltransferase
VSKLTRTAASRYWRTVHDETAADLPAVCFPDRSPAFNRFFHRMQTHALQACLRRLAVPLAGARLLDLGCGRGRWLEFYTARGADAVGLDIARAAAEACRHKGLRACQGSVTALPFADASFDIVSSVTVLQHVVPEDQGPAIREVERVLKPGGHAILLENTSDDPSSHVWGMSVSRWTALFTGSRMRFAENHYFIPLFRLLWRRSIRTATLKRLETLLLPLAYALEYGLMALRAGQAGAAGLQHVMAFAKGAPRTPGSGDPVR